MAGNAGAPSSIPVLATGHHSVEEMSKKGSVPPPQYFLKENTIRPLDSYLPPHPIPSIDLTLLSGDEEIQKLKSVLISWGCFQAIGHGISSSFLDKVREVAKNFFLLPVEEKEKHACEANGSEGYGNDRIVAENQVLDWSYRLSLRLQPVDQRKLQFWPDNPSDFREVLEEYERKVKIMMDVILKAMAKSLNLEEKSLSSHFGERGGMKARFLFYPRCARPDLVLGLKAHTDGSGITVLLQDQEVEGLQVLKDDKWFRVPIVPHALVVNLGDQMQIMSNGIFKSVIHRVVANSESMRISIAMFGRPREDKEVGVVEGLLSENRPRLYRNVKNYAAFNYECIQKGVVPLELVRI